MAQKVQTADNHAKLVPAFHYIAAPALLLFAMWAFLRVWDARDGEAIAFALLGIGVVLLWTYTRLFATQNQDRIIRLEERLRMHELLPESMHGRINDFTTRQLIALRFASDEELPALAKRVLDEGITDAKAIKRLITTWRADHQRV